MYNERSPHKTWTKSYWRMGSLDSGPSLLISLLWVCYPIRNHFVIYKVSVGQATFWSTWILKYVRWNWSHLKMHTEIFRKLCRISTFEKPLHLKYPPSYSTPKNQKKQMLFWHRLIVLSSFFFFFMELQRYFSLATTTMLSNSSSHWVVSVPVWPSAPGLWVLCILPKHWNRVYTSIMGIIDPIHCGLKSLKQAKRKYRITGWLRLDEISGAYLV